MNSKRAGRKKKKTFRKVRSTFGHIVFVEELEEEKHLKERIITCIYRIYICFQSKHFFHQKLTVSEHNAFLKFRSVQITIDEKKMEK